MKPYHALLSGIWVAFLTGQLVFAQAKHSSDSVFMKTKIKFSEMTDYGLPATSRINSDGSVVRDYKAEVIVPAEKTKVAKLKKNILPITPN